MLSPWQRVLVGLRGEQEDLDTLECDQGVDDHGDEHGQEGHGEAHEAEEGQGGVRVGSGQRVAWRQVGMSGAQSV